MQTKSGAPKLFGMTIFQIVVLIGLGLMLCLLLVLAIFVVLSNRNRPPAVLPNPTTQPTYTPYPTFTPPPVPTATSVGFSALEPTTNPSTAASSNSIEPVGELVKVNSWSLEIREIRVDPGIDVTRQVIVLLGNLTNEGTGTDTFSATFNVLLKDSQGRTYEEDFTAGFAAKDKYQTEYPALMNPGATVYISIAYDVPASEKYFTLAPGSLTSNWSGDISFAIP